MLLALGFPPAAMHLAPVGQTAAPSLSSKQDPLYEILLLWKLRAFQEICRFVGVGQRDILMPLSQRLLRYPLLTKVSP